MTQFSELKRQAEALLRQMGRGKEYIIGHVADRLMRAADDNAQDTVIRAVAHVIMQRSRQDPTRLISQAEIEHAYQNLVGLNASGTRFREVCGDLLLSELPPPVEPGKQYAEAHRDPMAEAVEEIDPALRQGLGSIFDPGSDRYDPRLASAARDKVALELKSMDLQPRCRIAGGNSRMVIVAADIGTRKGRVTVHIPADASGERLPSTFVAGDRLVPLTAANMKAYLEACEGTRESVRNAPVDIPALLASLDAATGSLRKQASAEDAAALAVRLPESDGSSGLSAGATFAPGKAGPEVRDVEVPRAPVPEPLKALAAEVEESAAEAGCGYPPAAVRLAKRMLHAELAGMGFRSAQVRVTGGGGDGLMCEAVLDTPRGKVPIEVPIEMRGNRPLMPTLFAQGDFCDDFEEGRIKAFVSRDAGTVPVAVRRSSPMLEQSWPQLKDELIQAVARGDFGTCEEVLEAVAQKFGPEVHKQAVAGYSQLLAVRANHQAGKGSGCARQLKTANSIHTLCGHLMVPLHKVVQDEHGRCHLASAWHARKAQQEEGAFFSAAKVLAG